MIFDVLKTYGRVDGMQPSALLGFRKASIELARLETEDEVSPEPTPSLELLKEELVTWSKSSDQGISVLVLPMASSGVFVRVIVEDDEWKVTTGQMTDYPHRGNPAALARVHVIRRPAPWTRKSTPNNSLGYQAPNVNTTPTREREEFSRPDTHQEAYLSLNSIFRRQIEWERDWSIENFQTTGRPTMEVLVDFRTYDPSETIEEVRSLVEKACQGRPINEVERWVQKYQDRSVTNGAWVIYISM